MPSLTLAAIRATRALLGERIVRTPVHHWRSPLTEAHLGHRSEILLKLELLQRTGTFKPRGALSNLLRLSRAELDRGVTAVSAGNHAIATAYAAHVLGTTAKVVMIRSANPYRVEACRRFGAELVFADDAHSAFEQVAAIEADEQRAFIHPFDGERTVLGQATVGLELCEQVEALDAVIIPIGGGGLAAGVATAVKLMQPRCRVYGVEPQGADSMHRSFAAGRPERIDAVRTIADSLGAPHAAPYSFELCRAHVDELVLIDDDAMRRAMRLLFGEVKLAVEPAGAAATAALWGPLAEHLRDQRVGVIVCGSNIDLPSWQQLVGAPSPG